MPSLPKWVTPQITIGNIVTLVLLTVGGFSAYVVRAHDVETLVKHDEEHQTDLIAIRIDIAVKNAQYLEIKESLVRIEAKLDQIKQ